MPPLKAPNVKAFGIILSGAMRQQPDRADLRSYIKRRIDGLSVRIMESAEELLSQASMQEDRRFVEDIERRLHNGARFIPRKRQPR